MSQSTQILVELVLCPWTLTGGAFGSITTKCIKYFTKVRTPNSSVRFVWRGMGKVILFLKSNPFYRLKKKCQEFKILPCILFVSTFTYFVLFITTNSTYSSFSIVKYRKDCGNLLSSSVVTMIGSLAFPSPFTVDANTKML